MFCKRRRRAHAVSSSCVGTVTVDNRYLRAVAAVYCSEKHKKKAKHFFSYSHQTPDFYISEGTTVAIIVCVSSLSVSFPEMIKVRFYVFNLLPLFRKHSSGHCCLSQVNDLSNNSQWFVQHFKIYVKGLIICKILVCWCIIYLFCLVHFSPKKVS